MIDFNESQWWSYERFIEFQNIRLAEILDYAYNNIPAYKNKFDEAKLKPADIKNKDDLYKLPITTREEMQNNPDFVNAELIYDTLYTGGSTGSSLKYYDSEESRYIRAQAHARGWLWNGYTQGKRLAVVSSAQGTVGGPNTLNLVGDLSTGNLKEIVEKLIEFKPQHLRGYVSSLYILAKYCLDNSVTFAGIESIDPISENLYDYQREVMERGFGCRVFEEYCCNDGGACAWECEAHEGLHYFMERAIIEEIDGEMIVTDLWNKAMPFIRYRNGDAIVFLGKNCSCGRQLPLVQAKGRTNDIIIGKNGPISPSFLVHHGIGLVGPDRGESHFRSGMRTVQYIQKPGYILEVNIVKNDWCTDTEITEFRRDLNTIAPGMQINVNFLHDIPTTISGKRSFIINEDKELLKTWGL
ncbi:MAG: hypothetical protein PHZ03_00480 [Syntrophomonas sp.]|nr:hypothetical protein [Syntrophomonas sp.]